MTAKESLLKYLNKLLATDMWKLSKSKSDVLMDGKIIDESDPIAHYWAIKGRIGLLEDIIVDTTAGETIPE